MSIPRSKNKKPKTHRPTKTPFEIVKMTNYLHLAIIVRILWTVYGWRSKRIADFLEAYLSLMQEVADHRNSVNGLIKDTKEMTGIDVVELLDDVMEGGQK